MRKVLSFLLVMTIMAVSFVCVACAPDHEHTYSTEWSKDETDHWHAATCSHTDEVKDKATHTAANFTSVSYKEGHKSSCSVCGYEFTAPHEFASGENKCTDCDFTFVGTEGLIYLPVTVDSETVAYSVVGLGGTGIVRDLVIPNAHEGKPVTSIGDGAFSAKDIDSVTVAPSVVSIGREAFLDCSALETIELGNNLEFIGYRAFDETGYYKSAKTQANKSNSDGGIYIGNYLLKFVATSTRKNAKVKAGTTLIAAYAFDENETPQTITGVQLPDSLVYINDYAFQMTMLAKVTIPENVEVIGGYAFYKCKEYLTEVKFAADSKLRRIGMYAFRECSALTAITLPNKLEYIGNRAFSKSGITSVTIPASVKVIEMSAFDDSALNEIKFESGSCLERIGEKAFNKTAITKIIIPVSVTQLDSQIFKSVSGLTVYFEGGEVPEDSADDWNITDAPYYFYSEAQPSEQGNYWHYVGGQPQAW